MSDSDTAAGLPATGAVASSGAVVKRGPGRPRKDGSPAQPKLGPKRGRPRERKSLSPDNLLLADGNKPRMQLQCDCGAWNHMSWLTCPTCKGLTPRGKKAQATRLNRQRRIKTLNDAK